MHTRYWCKPESDLPKPAHLKLEYPKSDKFVIIKQNTCDKATLQGKKLNRFWVWISFANDKLEKHFYLLFVS